MTDPRIQIDTIYGNCPVQATGTVDGRPFYFRARGSLTIDVADDPDGDPVGVGGGVPGWTWDGTDDPEWIARSGDVPTNEPVYFGWMSNDDALACIESVLAAYLAGPVDGVGGWERWR